MVIVFDLDDTLYNEIDFVKSGFKALSHYLDSSHQDELFMFMYDTFISEGSGKIFDKLLQKYNYDISLEKMIDIYRFHCPKIQLRSDALILLEETKLFPTALISDGPWQMQENKFKALGLNKWIDYPVYTDYYGTSKPNTKAYQMVMEHFVDEIYVYISDNPKKDFQAATELNWKTIRFKNNNGIYKNIPNTAMYEVTCLSECKNIISSFIT